MHPQQLVRGGIFLAFLFCTGLGANGFGAESPAHAPANSWIEIPNTKMKAVLPKPDQFPGTWGICGPASVVNAWSGGALDTKRNRLVLFGGGHGDYAGNELYAFDIGKMTWERITDPTPNPKVDDSDENSDGTPQSRHSYGGLAYLEHCDRYFALGGSIYKSGHAACNKVWTFDFAAQKWARAKDKPPFNPMYECSSAYDPATKKLWFCNVNAGSWAEVWCYEFDKEQWSRFKIGNDLGYGGVALDTKRGLLVALCAGKVKVYDVRGNKPGEAWQTTGDVLPKTGQVGFDYDPVADKFAYWGSDKVYVLDPEKKTWTIQELPGAPKLTTKGTYGRWRYVPSVNAFILVSSSEENVRFYKLSAGPGTGAPAPASATK
ncbi:MAG: hypothetical protein KIS92_15540 [Planctomycetota bacterium]|nr:hypothetical protein [Planctomycetota bacterium]